MAFLVASLTGCDKIRSLCGMESTASTPPAQTETTQAEPPPQPKELEVRGRVNVAPQGNTTIVTTEKTTETAPAQVETRAYVKDGKNVTETITTAVVRETVSTSTSPKTYKAAIFVANRAGQKYDGKIAVLEDLVSSRIADTGIQAISREVAIDAARKFDPTLASSPRPADSLDTQLSNQTSALRLAQNLGADYIIQVSLNSIGAEKRVTRAYGTEITNYEFSALVSYKILEGTTGAALTGDTVRPSRTEQVTEFSDGGATNLIDGLLFDASQKIADGLQTRVAANRIASVTTAPALATISIIPEIAGLQIPDIRLSENNTVLMPGGQNKVSALNVTVEVDGVAVGSAPGKIQLRPGLSKLRLTREGFRPWERTINATDGQVLTAAMTMDDASLARWAQLTSFISNLKNNEKLTDAQVKVIEGQAQMLRQSGYRIDYKVDTKDGLNVRQKSIF